LQHAQKKKSENSNADSDDSECDDVEVKLDRKIPNQKITKPESKSSFKSTALPSAKLLKAPKTQNKTELCFESITIGSSKNAKKGVKPNIVMSGSANAKKSKQSKKDTDNDSSGMSSSEGNESIATHDIQHINSKTLKDITEYNVENIKKMAKTYAIALTEKTGNSRRQLTKLELYNKIKEHLTHKKISQQ
jgi:hypothetical protein